MEATAWRDLVNKTCKYPTHGTEEFWSTYLILNDHSALQYGDPLRDLIGFLNYTNLLFSIGISLFLTSLKLSNILPNFFSHIFFLCLSVKEHFEGSYFFLNFIILLAR